MHVAVGLMNMLYVRLLRFQECRLFNKTLCKVERCLEIITHRLAGGYLAIPPNYRHIALTIGQGVVPQCWLRGHAMKSDAPFKEWVAELKTVSMHLEDLVEEWYKRAPTGLVTTHKVRLELVHKPKVFIDILKHIKSHQLQSPHHKVIPSYVL